MSFRGVFLRSVYVNDPNDLKQDAFDSVCVDFSTNKLILNIFIGSFQIMAIVSDHPVWRRTRRNHHGGAWRDYLRDTSNDCTSPRGPGTAPFQCSKCEGNSPMLTSDYYSCSSQSSSEDENTTSSFNMKGIVARSTVSNRSL